MPYVDEGERQPINLPPILPFVAAVIAAGVGAVSWLGCFKWFGMSYPGALVAGLLVGLAFKFTLKKPVPQARIVAIVLTVVASLAGYIWVFAAYYTNFSFGSSLAAFFRDIQAILFTGFGCYIGFALATPRRFSKPAGDPTA